jgi:hypothetical protein
MKYTAAPSAGPHRALGCPPTTTIISATPDRLQCSAFRRDEAGVQRRQHAGRGGDGSGQRIHRSPRQQTVRMPMKRARSSLSRTASVMLPKRLR